MESSLKIRELNMVPSSYSNSNNQTTTVMKILSNESFTVMASLNSDVNITNNCDLNAAASLSDDSGVPLTTNSSISSGDSYKLEIYKNGSEIVESDGEVSQFDSLENCSESGMSTENFNTLKKGPLAPIEPPPEFQDSPQNTLRRTISQDIYNSLRRSTSSQSPFEHIKDRMLDKITNAGELPICKGNVDSLKTNQLNVTDTVDSYTNKHFYSSDSTLNSNKTSSYEKLKKLNFIALSNNADTYDSEFPICQSEETVCEKTKQIKCKYYEDHTRYFRAIPSEQDMLKSEQQIIGPFLEEIQDYDMYYSFKRNYELPRESTLPRKIIRSPLNHSYHCHHYQASVCNRPNSRNSLCSRLSSSHNSLNIFSTNKPDDSIFITQAMSHDALLSKEISDFYTVPIDSDIYAFPIDMIESGKVDKMKPVMINSNIKTLKLPQVSSQHRQKRKKRKSEQINNENYEECKDCGPLTASDISCKFPLSLCNRTECENSQNHFVSEELHLTLDQVKDFYQTLFSETDASQRHQSNESLKKSKEILWNTASITSPRDKQMPLLLKSSKSTQRFIHSDMETLNEKNNHFSVSNKTIKRPDINNKKISDCGIQSVQNNKYNSAPIDNAKKSVYINEKRSHFTLNLKQKFCSIFRFRRPQNSCRNPVFALAASCKQTSVGSESNKQTKFQSRALPPVPKKNDMCPGDDEHTGLENKIFHFASSIEKVKDYGWYWGPLSSEAAEKVLSNEPDGSFIVRDSSDDHYIFSLSFKLNNCVRHVRIEQDQGTFSFGSYAKFKSQTITEFIEKAVDHSRSGRYLFFLHRRPEHGPMRVQLTNPVSRFKHVQSLQHMCRFVILKTVIRKDLIQTLPLPRRLLDYLNYKHCFSEQIENESLHSQVSADEIS